MTGARSSLMQAFPPKPKFTDKDLPDLHGKGCPLLPLKVYLVTGANTGVGKEITQILYAKNAKVYLAARSEEKTLTAIDRIKAAVPNSTGELTFLHLDLADLTTIKASAQEFLRKEPKLDVLFNNAGVGYPEQGSKTKQGYELQLGVNCVGAFLFTKFLTPLLVETAKTAPRDSVRVVWVSSSAAEAATPRNFINNLDYHEDRSSFDKYCTSKIGNYFHAVEFAARHKADGVISVSLNPGNLDSDFWRTQGPIITWILKHTVLYPPIYGAYTNLFAALSSDVTIEKTGSFLAPWGRFWKLSKDLTNASKTKAEGGTELARQFWVWSEAQVKSYL